MPDYIKDIETFTDPELESKLADEIKSMESFSERAGYKPASYWTHVVNKTILIQQLERRRKRRENGH